MISVSQEFQDILREPNRRKILGRVQIDYSDPFIDQSIQINTNENNYTSYPKQVADGIQEPSGRLICLDGTWTLGNRDWVLAPGKNEIDKYQMGWWGSSLSDSDGKFDVTPTLSVHFFPRPIRSLKVVGDSKRNEYPVNFNINLYGEDGLLYQEIVTNNTLVNWNKDIEQINEVIKMELEIIKWNIPNRCVKILEFFTSIQEAYEDKDVISINLLEEREANQGSLPVGNISSNEISIRLNNESKKFDIGNKQSTLYNLIKPGRRIKAWIGIERNNGVKEFVSLGVFWAKDWNVPEKGQYAEVVGRDRLESLRDTTFSTSMVEINKTLYDLAIEVLKDAGLKDSEYWVDTELKQFNIPYSYFEPQSHREALRKIAEAGLGQVYCNREGVIRVEGPSFTENKVLNSIVPTFLQGPTFPAEIEVLDAYAITQDDYFTKMNPSRRESVANMVEVETQPLRPSTAQEIYKSNEDVLINANETKQITIYFNNSPCIDVSLNIEGTGTIKSTKIYAWGADITITSTTKGTFKIIATGKPLTVQNKEKAISKDANSIIENGELKYTFSNNPLIQNLGMAQNIANKLLQYYKDPKADLDLDWRGNPALELGDIIVAYDYYTSTIQERGYYYVTRQELEYAGGLNARLSGRRAI